MTKEEGGAHGKSNQRNVSHRSQAGIGNEHFESFGVHHFRPVLVRVKKSVFERPVLGQVHPAVVLILPAVVAKAANGCG